ncbi:MAG: carbonic anhydrase family protein [Cyclobacteriaceae bacterium]
MKSVLFILIFAIAGMVVAQQDQSLYRKQHLTPHKWSYDGMYGPEHWKELDEEFRTCDGILQSPINIAPDQCPEVHIDLTFHYRPFLVDLVNNGYTLIERVVELKALTFNHTDYTLLQFHFHTPSEHQVDGEGYPMEIHFVHQSSKGKYAVLAVFMEEGDKQNAFLAHFMNALPTHVMEEIRTTEQADVMETMPADPSSFYFYDGSLTTPPCTEGVNWIILKEPVMATSEQIEAIHCIIENDNRPIQDLNDRVVFWSH